MLPPQSSHEIAPTPPLENRPSPAELWTRYSSTGPGDSSEEDLIKKYLPLVKTVVGRLAMTLPSHVDGDDLYSAGLVGLLNALRQYNPRIGTAFEPYARVRIRGAILDELRRMDWAPRSIHTKARQVQRTMEILEQRLGRIPADDEIAAALELSPDAYQELLSEIRPATFICLDTASTTDGDGEQTEHESLGDPRQESPLERTSQAELAELIAGRIEQLPELYRKIIAMYYYEDMRVCEIARACGFCEAHICQTHTKAILAIRSFVEQHEGVAYQRSNLLSP
ncbi:MAG: polymerase sigma factor FliA [Verrucomicrobiota bacterium]|jgi:RNA polymerase sigma factor for flagellar operon FliA